MPPKKSFDIMDVGKKVAGAGKELLEKGKTLFGSPEAKFNQSVKEKMKRESKTKDEAQRECLADLARSLQTESSIGVLDKKSKSFQEFKGALKVLLDKKELQQCKKDSEDGLYTPKGARIDKDDIDNQKSYYEQKYKNYGGNYIPDMRMVSRHAQQTKEIEAITVKISSELASGLLDIAALKAGGIAESADIGKFLLHKKTTQKGCFFM
jgi:hypothetical protein